MSIGATSLALALLSGATSPQPPDQEQPPIRQARIGPLGWGGIGSLAAGAPALATGISLLIIDEHSAPNHPTQVRDFMPAGAALTATGAALTITGAVLLAVDRKRGRDRQVSFSPRLGPNCMGLVASGRF